MHLVIVARVSPTSRAFLEDAVEPDWHLTFEQSTRRLLDACGKSSCDVLVLDAIDPILIERATRPAGGPRGALPPTVVLLSDVSAESLRAIQTATIAVHPQIAWCGPGYKRQMLTGAIAAASLNRLAASVASQLLDALNERPLDMRIEPFVLGLFRAPWDSACQCHHSETCNDK